MPVDPERHSRQMRFAPLGAAGQARLAAAGVAVVGCGALGSVVAMALTRAGVGRLRIIDRDVPERSNLPRQVLFDEADVAAGIPKAVAAAGHLERIDSSCRIEPVVADLTAASAARLLGGVDLIVDGTDNFEARFLVNEFACRAGIPWVHGGAIGAEGRVLAVLPGRTACLRCLVPEPPAPGALPTCETAGIIGPAALVVGAVEAAEAIKILVGALDRVGNRLLVCDLWENLWRCVDLAPLAAAGCPTPAGGLSVARGARRRGRHAAVRPRRGAGRGAAGGGGRSGRLRRADGGVRPGDGQSLDRARGARGGDRIGRVRRRAGHRLGDARRGPGPRARGPLAGGLISRPWPPP